MTPAASLLALVLLAPAEGTEAGAPADAVEPATDTTPAAPDTGESPAPVEAGEPVSAQKAPISKPPGRAKTGRGMLIAGGVLTGLGVVGRIGLEVFWSTSAQIIPSDPFPRWSVADVVFLTNWNNIMFFGPGLGLLTAGAYRRGGFEARGGKLRDGARMRKVGIGLLAGGLGLWALSRAVFLPLSDACSNRCAYTTLETTFWIAAGATFAGAAHLAYGSGYEKARTSVRVAPSVAPGFMGVALAGRF